MIHIKQAISPVEAVAASTAGSAVVSAVYNYGFFSELDGSMISWLTVQDLIVGAAIAFLPTALLVQILLSILKPAVEGSKIAFYVLITIFVLTSIAILTLYLIVGGKIWTQAFITFALISYLVSAIVIKSFDFRSAIGIISLALCSYNAAYSAGRLMYIFSMYGYEEPITEIFTSDNKIYTGKLIRVTSEYSFVFDGNLVTIINNRNVTAVKMLRAKGAL
jgi:hypothetical protein